MYMTPVGRRRPGPVPTRAPRLTFDRRDGVTSGEDT